MPTLLATLYLVLAIPLIIIGVGLLIGKGKAVGSIITVCGLGLCGVAVWNLWGIP